MDLCQCQVVELIREAPVNEIQEVQKTVERIEAKSLVYVNSFCLAV